MLALFVIFATMVAAAPTGQTRGDDASMATSSADAMPDVSSFPHLDDEMLLTLVKGSSGAAVPTNDAGKVNTHDHQDDLDYIAAYRAANMPMDPYGINHLGDDGVMRSLAADGTVLGFVKLSNKQLMQATVDKNETTYLHLRSVW